MPKAQAQSEIIDYIGKISLTTLLAFARHGERFASKTPWHYKGERGANLRQILLQNGVDLYNNDAKVVDCRGIGSCVPYAVLVEGEVFKRQIGMKSAAVNTTRFFSQQGCA